MLLATVVLEVDVAGAEADVVPVDVLDAGAVLVCGGGGTGLVVFVDGADGVEVGVVLDVGVGLVDAVELVGTGVLGGGADAVVALVVVEDVLVDDVEEVVDDVELVDEVDELVDVEDDVGAVLVVAAGVEGAAGAVVVVTGAVEPVEPDVVTDLRLSVPAPPLNTTGIDDWCETD